jgi:hypothetical protein
VEFAPLALVLLLPECFLILSTSESSPLKGWMVGIGIGIGYKLSHDEVGKKEIEDWNWSNIIQLRERDGQSVPCFVSGDNRF